MSPAGCCRSGLFPLRSSPRARQSTRRDSSPVSYVGMIGTPLRWPCARKCANALGGRVGVQREARLRLHLVGKRNVANEADDQCGMELRDSPARFRRVDPCPRSPAKPWAQHRVCRKLLHDRLPQQTRLGATLQLGPRDLAQSSGRRSERSSRRSARESS